MTEWTHDKLRTVNALMAQGMGRQERLDKYADSRPEADENV